MNVTFSRLSPFLRGLLFQIFSALAYFYLQFALLRALQLSFFALYSSLNALGAIFVHLSSLGSDSRLYSELISSPSLRLRLRDYFTYIPSAIFFSLFVSLILEIAMPMPNDTLFVNILFISSIIFSTSFV